MDTKIKTQTSENKYTNTRRKELAISGKTILYEDDLIYGIKEPRYSCKYCHGTGKIAWTMAGEPVLCKCLRRKGKGEWITTLAYKTLCESNRLKIKKKGINYDW